MTFSIRKLSWATMIIGALFSLLLHLIAIQKVIILFKDKPEPMKPKFVFLGALFESDDLDHSNLLKNPQHFRMIIPLKPTTMNESRPTHIRVVEKPASRSNENSLINRNISVKSLFTVISPDESLSLNENEKEKIPDKSITSFEPYQSIQKHQP